MPHFAGAAERNKHPILAVLKPLLHSGDCVLEVGSGTGQHAVFFCEQIPDISWQPSDLIEQHPSIEEWIASCPNNRILAPLELDVQQRMQWPQTHYDVVFSANTAHIMPWEAVQSMLAMAHHVLRPQGLLILYGPFNQNHQFTSPSNAQFDAHLKSIAAHMGIRDIDDICDVATDYQLHLQSIEAMPSHNHMLIFRQSDSE